MPETTFRQALNDALFEEMRRDERVIITPVQRFNDGVSKAVIERCPCLTLIGAAKHTKFSADEEFL